MRSRRQALAFASGIAAMTAVVEAAGRHGRRLPRRRTPARSRSSTRAALGRMTVRPVDFGDAAAVLAALDGAGALARVADQPAPGVPDLPRLVAAAHEAGAVVGVDATFATPLNVRPSLGADLVMHWATKYLAGHSDVLMGVLVTALGRAARALRRPPHAHRRDPAPRGVPGAARAADAGAAHGAAQANAQELARRLRRTPAWRGSLPGAAVDP